MPGGILNWAIVAFLADPIGEALAAAIAVAGVAMYWSFAAWFVVYTTVGAWLKVRLTIGGKGRASDAGSRLAPVMLCHVLYSIVFANPYTFFAIADTLIPEDLPDHDAVTIIYLVSYFWLLPMGIDSLLIRAARRWECLRWFRCSQTRGRAVLANLVASLTAFGGGLGAFYLYCFLQRS